MAPSKRLSDGGTPGQQRSISSFFSPGKPSTPANVKSQRPISSYFSLGPNSTPESIKKPVLCIGPSKTPSKPTVEIPSELPSKRPQPENTPVEEPSFAKVKRRRVSAEAAFESPCDGTSKHNPKTPNLDHETLNLIPNSSDSRPDALIGKKLKVYWPMDDAWYEGCLKSYDQASGRHVVLYDDGEEEHVVLAEEKVEWLENDSKITPAPHRFRRLRKLGEKDSKNGNASSPVDGDVELVSEFKMEVESPSCDRIKGASVQRKVQFSGEDEESEGDYDSDEDWGKNAKNVDSTDDSDSEENGELEKEEVQQRRKGAKKNTTQTARGKNKNITKAKGVSKLDNICPSSEWKVKMPSVLLGSKQGNKSGMKPFGQDDGGGLPQKPEALQDKIFGDEIPITLTGEIAERFNNRTKKFKFLFEGRRDANGKKPEDPEYDPRTLYLPKDFLKGLTGGQRQWWEFKSQHMDKVLFFKMGKFYELFEMDAHIGALELDLQYMKGGQPHCGFPEKNFTDNVEKLAQKGYRVLVVEQTETPDQLEQRRKETGSKEKVVKREICAVITKGTMTEGGMLATCPDANYMMSITERIQLSGIENHAASVIGVCVADASTSRFILGQFTDDSTRSRLCSLLSEIRPVELIKPRGMLFDETERVLRDCTRKPLINNLAPGREFWDAQTSLFEIKKLYKLFCDRSKSSSVTTDKAKYNSSSSTEHNTEIENLPDVICQVVRAGENGELALSAFGGCLFYLRQVLLDQSLLSFGKLETMPCSDFATTQLTTGESKQDCHLRGTSLVEPYMVLDAAALENLEILENNKDGSSLGTLFTQVDHCITAFGKRLLRRWLVRPLKSVESILERQNAIAEIKGAATDSAVNFRKELARLPDMERLLARLYASSEAAGRNANKVVLYEDAAKKKLQEFIAALRGCQSMVQACVSFKATMKEMKSTLLQHNLTPGRGLPDVKPIMKQFVTAFDWSEAEKTGRILPCEGVDKDYDMANQRVREIETGFAKHLEMQQMLFGSDAMITYVTVGKEQYQIEIPESMLAKVPQEYEARSSRKGYRRFWTPKIKELLQELSDAQIQREASLRGILQGLVRQFCEHHHVWRCIVNLVAEMDVLISLAFASDYFDGPTCRPTVRYANKFSSDEVEAPFIYAKGLRHPILAGLAASGSFVPNDVNIGGLKNSSFMLLTGPNMGGKSTLLRQVCLAIILAQLGADVPAEEFQLSPVDRVFVRMGARDHIMAAQSTFLVELSETASMLSSATRDSFVALDELGRGTATSDGQAIAHAVLEHLSHRIGCRGMFSTHYHHLATDYQNDPTVGLYHMGCKVGTRVGGAEEVTFLYKITPGACPKSYGVNVARLAGMPDTILERAVKQSADFERQYGQRTIGRDARPLTSIICKEGMLLEEVINVINNIHSSQIATATKMNNLVGVWQKLVPFAAKDYVHTKSSSGASLFDDHSLCSTIPIEM
ncbi:hypothetical protein SUGI_0341380 [Cryptomeria japonica]|uniref:DNA mismatch repair protein MSH6 isoform X2 n=1 Tax=Cryptomeria japonica TaxID=3369 RepID=UPI002408B516|nr:DNA mismatch repair protein MSH6 isoform X2 [Cryptomeria japonica]GLJ19028.1 hypothetical protein SUGI_0341380 [Cryptomeria japonica]